VTNGTNGSAVAVLTGFGKSVTNGTYSSLETGFFIGTAACVPGTSMTAATAVAERTIGSRRFISASSSIDGTTVETEQATEGCNARPSSVGRVLGVRPFARASVFLGEVTRDPKEEL
jgi:hypothetical protein